MAPRRGLPAALPRRGWALVLACVVLAAATLVIPPAVVTDRGVSFATFFWAVTAFQGLTALGVAAVVWYYHGGLGDDADAVVEDEENDWQYEP